MCLYAVHAVYADWMHSHCVHEACKQKHVNIFASFIFPPVVFVCLTLFPLSFYNFDLFSSRCMKKREVFFFICHLALDLSGRDEMKMDKKQ